MSYHSRDARAKSFWVLVAGTITAMALALGSSAALAHGQHSLGSDSLRWEGELNHRFLSSNGRRGFLFAIGNEGVEGYLYPFRVFHDLRVSFRVPGSEQSIEGRLCAKTAVATPSSITRVYSAPGLSVRETLFVPRDRPVLIITYEVDSAAALDLDVSLRPDLDLMWPGGIGGQTYSWDDPHHDFMIEEPSGRYSARIGSPDATSHSDPLDRSHPWITDKVLSLRLRAVPHRVVPLVATIGYFKHDDARALYESALREFPSWMREADAYYRDLLQQRLKIVTGDAKTDAALEWATVALDQAEVCNPDLGCGLLAGYGPTWDTRRPQYAWFFAGDALVTSMALEAEGAHDETVRALTFIRKYQDAATGAIWHEISQAATSIDWFHLYPYVYRHTDISPQYLFAVRNIWQATGDRELLDESWPSLEAAWRFCLAHVDPADGLMVIPPDQSGVNENEADRTLKELPLELVWAAGADAFSELAATTGHREESAQARAAYDRAKESLQEFWDPKRHFYFEGLKAENHPFTQQMDSAAFGAWQGLLPIEQRDYVLDRLAQPAFTTPWGLRSIPSDDPAYQPNSYGHGSVWPLATETYILATLAAHRPEQAWPMWKSLVDDSFLGSPGHIPEVLSGESQTALDISVPEQTWSSAALVTSTVRGILGLNPDAPHNQLSFEPHLPPGVDNVAIHGFRFGPRTLDFMLQRSSTGIDLSVRNSGEPFELRFAPQVSGAAPRVRATLNGREISAELHKKERDVHALVTCTVKKNERLSVQATLPAR